MREQGNHQINPSKRLLEKYSVSYEASFWVCCIGWEIKRVGWRNFLERRAKRSKNLLQGDNQHNFAGVRQEAKFRVFNVRDVFGVVWARCLNEVSLNFL